ncbi:MAG TPA: hypothetical protein VNZ52_05805, partial [Candidatus Thermoplasmatota archaeon]|nr:hypothetical protein [Candidatus Thermoplasmatota archaeon]
MRGPLLGLALAALLLVPSTLAQGADGSGSGSFRVTKLEAYNLTVGAVGVAAPRALEAGNRDAALENVTAASALVNRTFRGDFERASPLPMPAVEALLARARTAVAENRTMQLRETAAGLDGALAAGAFYAFESAALAGDVPTASEYLALLADRFALTPDSPVATQWEAAVGNPQRYLELAERAVGRSSAATGLFDAFLGEAARALNLNGTLPLEAVAARYAALALLPEVEARSGAATADALARGLAAPDERDGARAALLAFLGPRGYVLLHLDLATGFLEAGENASAREAWAIAYRTWRENRDALGNESALAPRFQAAQDTLTLEHVRALRAALTAAAAQDPKGGEHGDHA